MIEDALDFLALADDRSHALGVTDWHGPSLPGDAQSTAGGPLPLPAVVQPLFHRGGQEIWSPWWQLPGPLADLSLPPLESRGPRSPLIKQREFPDGCSFSG